MSTPAKIAVWNTAFLGDAVLTLPLLQRLRRAYPEAAIDFYVRKGFAALFECHPALSGVYEYDKQGPGKGPFALAGELRALGGELRARSYDLWLSAHRSARSGLIAKLSGAPRRIGYAEPWPNRLFYTDVVKRLFYELDECNRLLRLTLPLGLPPLGAERERVLWPEIFLPPKAKESAEELLAGLARGGARPLLGLHPGSVWATKRWPAEYFAALGRLAAEQGGGIVLFAGPGEEEIAGQVRRELLESVSEAQLCDLSGRLTLAELAACIGRLDCYVTNDSGPMHLAWAQRVPVVALFGPTVSEFGFAPRGEKSRLFEVKGLACRPCGLHGPIRCPEGHHRCMRDLPPELVWPCVRDFLFASARATD